MEKTFLVPTRIGVLHPYAWAGKLSIDGLGHAFDPYMVHTLRHQRRSFFLVDFYFFVGQISVGCIRHGMSPPV